MEGRRRRKSGMEENTMAILDTSGFNKPTKHLTDDRLAFLEAVRSASIVPENGTAPTNKMFEAIFQILKDENSLDLIMASYQLLIELDERFPRVYISRTRKSESRSPSTVLQELVVVEEAWSPFNFGSDVACNEKHGAYKNSGGSFDSSGFHLLIQDLTKMAGETKSETFETKLLRNMLLFQYLVKALEGDFLPRNCVYKENMEWTLMRESLLNRLLGSRRIIYRSLIKDCLSVVCQMSYVYSEANHDTRYPENSGELLENHNTAVATALPEVEKCTCNALQKLLLMIMELDTSKKMADMHGVTTRVDGIRTPAVEIILDELIYDMSILCPFLQVFDEPQWKLEIILQYFQKYIAKPSVRTRRSNGSTDDMTFGGILKCFSNSNTTRSVIKKISAEVVQLLLAHAFQAYLSLSLQHPIEGISNSKEVRGSSLVEICENLISAFTCLKRTDEHMEILPFGKEALFSAATILSTMS